MKSLIFYDNTGKIFFKMDGVYLIPQGGLQYIEEEISSGKRPVSVDVSSTPNKLVLEDMPKTEIEVAQERIQALEDYILEKETSNITDSL